MKKALSILIVFCSLTLLAACGGGNDVPEPTPIPTPTPTPTPEPDPEPTPDKDADPDPNGAQESAQDAIKYMGVGWNVGNTLDSNSGDLNNMWIEGWGGNVTPDKYETAWGQRPITRELIHMMKEAGFRSIRVPVTWYPHMEADFSKCKIVNGTPQWDPIANPIGTKIKADWMARVKEVVDYVIEEGLYCILNVHHDTGSANTHWLIASEASYKEHYQQFEAVWTQIAETFRDYNKRLMFEGYNEMLDEYDSWCFASFAAPNNYNGSVAQSAYKAINNYAQTFVNAVRATGGNNATRNLIVNTYAACCGEGNWNSHLQDPLKEMKVPSDPIGGEGHIFFQVHTYPNFKTLTDGKNMIDATISSLKTHLASKAPVIIGEWGSGGGISYENDKASYLNFATYFVHQCKANNMPTFYWMGMCDGADRAVPKMTQPDLATALMNGWK